MEIGQSERNSARRKTVYRGITALARMCVGDIGDVISLYEQILRNANASALPVAPRIQSECFQDFCARRLYDLNRRGGFLKDVAKSFAEASYDLLVQSCKAPLSKDGKRRIRQYSSLYVRITTGDIEQQTEKLRELIDAGVFVFAGGSNVPRAKTRDSNLTQQFKLTYRKIYGLVNFIGLAERDRFELSGTDLENWLKDPEHGNEILRRNLRTDPSGDKTTEDLDIRRIDTRPRRGRRRDRTGEQFLLFRHEDEGQYASRSSDSKVVAARAPIVEHLTPNSVAIEPFDYVVAGLGFEERTQESLRRICSLAHFRSALCIEYCERGRRTEIEAILAKRIAERNTISYLDVLDHGLPELQGNVMIDITGLAKPVIFHAVRNELRRKRSVWVCHTGAREYYPLHSDLNEAFGSFGDDDSHVVLDQLRDILTGETGPYKCDGLLAEHSDYTRQRVLCASASPKHERLLSLLDYRDYDRIEIVAPSGESPRDRVANIAAAVAARNNANSSVTRIDSNDLARVVEFLAEKYRLWCLDNGFNFEFGLTGSKMHTVASAAISAVYKVSQCWYIGPREFDEERFTRGVRDTRFFKITLREG